MLDATDKEFIEMSNRLSIQPLGGKMDAMHKSAAVRGLFMGRTAELELPVESGE